MLLDTDAIVLRRAQYGDYDRMLSLLSPELGRVDAISRGCRRPKSALMAASEVFCAGTYTLNLKDGRYSVTQCAISDIYYELRLDVDKLEWAARCLALADAAAVPGQQCEGLFKLLLKALAHICYTDMAPDLLASAFEMRYMPLLGYAPCVDRCVVCGGEVASGARFDAARGGTVCLRCPSGAPKLSEGARRIIYKAATTDYNLVPKLEGHPDWPEAARIYRPFVDARIELRQ